MYCPMVAPNGLGENENGTREMPHVITQWKPGSSVKDGIKGKERGEKKSKLGLRRQRSDLTSPSTASLQSTPKGKRWDFSSIRHIRQSSDGSTPKSAIDPVFELPASNQNESPTSSTPSFLAELEDTSRIAIHSKRSMFPGSQLEFQSSAITSRSVIKVIDETIAAIEADNRALLSRAVSAEQMVKALREQNYNLQLRLDHYENHHHRRPRATLSQPQRRNSRRVSNVTPPPSDTSSPSNSPLKTSPTTTSPFENIFSEPSFRNSHLSGSSPITTATGGLPLGSSVPESSNSATTRSRNSISRNSQSSRPSSRSPPIVGSPQRRSVLSGTPSRKSVSGTPPRISPTGGAPLIYIPANYHNPAAQKSSSPKVSSPKGSSPTSPLPGNGDSEALSTTPQRPSRSDRLSAPQQSESPWPSRDSSIRPQISYATLSGLPKVAPLNISNAARCGKPLPNAPSPQQDKLDPGLGIDDQDIRRVIEEEKREMDRRFAATIKAIEMEEKTWL
ncbi:hypothetical protein G7Y89_g283 [Cudoniella acicularis]|uniref:Uncharacterized protein n=1 Tax=Cudoniella acicularis TaxID=354080 RepID=A0A8H4W907_9HELO|nr:hypothetical protein G7Y89_g283 [Cudoniella acicularis]